MPATKTGHFKEQQLGKGTQKKILEAMERTQKTTENMKIVRNGPRKASVGEDCRAASSTIKTKGREHKKIPFRLQWNEKELERWRRTEIPKGRGPKGTSPSGESNTPVCDHFHKGQNQKESACDHWHPPECSPCTNPKMDANGWTSVYSSAQAKPMTTHLVMWLLPYSGKKQKTAKDLHSQYDRFWRTSDGHQPRNNSECDIVAMRKDICVQEKEKHHRWRTCINSGLKSVNKNHALQHGSCAKACTRYAGRTMKIMRRSSRQRFLPELSLGQQSVTKKDICCRLRRIYAYYEQEWHRSRRARCISEIERILYDYYGEWVNHYDRRSYCPRQRFEHVYFRPITGRLTCCTLARHMFVKKMVILMKGLKILAHIDQTWLTQQLQVGQRVPIVVLGVIVDTVSRSDAEAASWDRASTASGEREQDLPGWLEPFTERLAKGDSGSSGSDWETFPSTPPPHIPASLWDTHLIYSFFEGPQLWNIQTHKITNSMQTESWKSRRQDTASFKIWRYNHSGSQSSEWRERIAIASSICGSGAGFGFSMETELSVQKQDCTRYDDKFAAILTSRKQAWSYLHW